MSLSLCWTSVTAGWLLTILHLLHPASAKVPQESSHSMAQPRVRLTHAHVHSTRSEMADRHVSRSTTCPLRLGLVWIVWNSRLHAVRVLSWTRSLERLPQDRIQKVWRRRGVGGAESTAAPPIGRGWCCHTASTRVYPRLSFCLP